MAGVQSSGPKGWRHKGHCAAGGMDHDKGQEHSNTTEPALMFTVLLVVAIGDDGDVGKERGGGGGGDGKEISSAESSSLPSSSVMAIVVGPVEEGGEGGGVVLIIGPWDIVEDALFVNRFNGDRR